MPAPEAVAHDFQRRQKSTFLALIAAILGLWRRLDRERLTESWQGGVGRSMVDAMTRTQLEVASMVPAYLRDLAEAQGIDPPEFEVVPAALTGIASDGRPLESLMYQPIIAFKRLLADGVDPNEAMRRATAAVTMIAATQAADAGRAAVNAGTTANKAWARYVRVVNLPACSRCVILAGTTYAWNADFQRHPNCDCTAMGVTGDVDVPSPRDLFDQMSPQEQDRRFGKAGALSVRLGADLGQVVNARRGMSSAGGRLVTKTGTSRRGAAGRRLRGRVRLMPETIIADAAGDRDAAIRALRENGYLIQR